MTSAPSEVTTQLSAAAGEVPVGGSASDSATLHGVTGTAGGTVAYRVYDSLSACQSATSAFPPASGGTLVSTVTVTGGVVPPSAAATFGTAGTFYWAAFYSGDPSNLAAASDCATEPLVVTPAASRVTTQLSAANRVITVGGSASDSATLDGVTGTAGGAVAYRFYGSLTGCESDVIAFPGTPPSGGTLVSTVTVTGGVVPPSAAHTFGTTGTFYWGAFYSGDPNNGAAASRCATEPLVVTPAASQLTTQLSPAGGQIGVGGSASDSATLAAVTGTAGGTVAYRLYDSLPACETDVAAFPATPPPGGTLVSTVTVTGGIVPPSAAHTFAAAGTFYWAAFYSGDPSNLPSASDCATEPLEVTPATSQVTTQLSATGGEIGGRRVGERLRDTERRHRHRGRDRGLPALRFAACLRDRRGGVPRAPRHPAARWYPPSRSPAAWCRPRPRTPSPPRAPSTGPRSTPATPATSRRPATAPPSPWSSTRPPRRSPRVVGR